MFSFWHRVVLSPGAKRSPQASIHPSLLQTGTFEADLWLVFCQCKQLLFMYKYEHTSSGIIVLATMLTIMFIQEDSSTIDPPLLLPMFSPSPSISSSVFRVSVFEIRKMHLSFLSYLNTSFKHQLVLSFQNRRHMHTKITNLN